MGKTSSKKHWLYVQCLTVLGLLLPVGCYFFIYLPSQQAYFANRDFRVLSLVSDQLKARVENSAKALQNVARTTSTNEADFGMRIKSAMELIPTLTLVSASITPSASNTDDWVKLSVEPDVGTSLLMFQYTTTNIISFKARADFNNFVAIRPEFDGLLVAEQDGTVMFQRSPEGWRVLNLSGLVDTKGQKLQTNLQSQSSSMTTVNLAGTDYRLFLQPLQISTNVRGPTNQWWVGGVVKSGRFTAESLAISHTYLVGFIFLVLLSLAALPFAKLRLMGAREKLGKADVFFLMLSSVGGSAALTLLLLNTYTYQKTENILDDQLKDFATHIADNLNAETAAMYRQLTEFRDKSAVGTHATPYTGNTNWVFLTNLFWANPAIINPTNCEYPYFEQVGWVKSDGWQRQKWTVRHSPTPFINIKERSYFKDALDRRHSLYEFRNGDTNFWLESILSWNTGESSAVMSIRHTNEVVTMDSKLLSLMRPVVPAGFGYCVVANDGRVLFHSNVGRNLQENLLLECDNAPALRAALLGGTSEPFDALYQGKIHSFYLTPLAGFNWSLAVFRNEYLLDSADFDLLLISVYLLGFYLGLLIVIWLVIFRWILRASTDWLWPDEEKNGSYELAFWGSSLIGLGALLAIAFIPDPLTAAAIGTAAALVAVGLFYLSLKYSWHLGFNLFCFKINFVLALASLVLATAIVPAFAFFKASHGAQMELFVKQGQLHFAKALQERIARVENDYQRIQIDGPDRSGWTNFLDQRLSIANRSLDLYHRAFFETEFSQESHASPAEDGDPTRDWFKDFLAKLRPFHYRTGVETHGLFRESAVDTSYKWGWGRKDTNARKNLDSSQTNAIGTLRNNRPRLVLHKDNFRRSQLLYVRSTLPEFFRFKGYAIGSIFFVVFGLGLCIAVFYLARFVARQVFLLGVSSQPSPKQSARHTLVLRSALPAERTSTPFINWSSSSEELKGQIEKLNAELAINDHTEKTIAVVHFERGFQNAEFNCQKLELLEKLVTEGRHNVRVYSTVDPSHFRVLGPAAKPGESTSIPTVVEDPAVQQNRWDNLFRFFAREDDGANGIPAAGEAQTIQKESENQEPAYDPSRWWTHSKAEQLALYQLAKEGFINAKNPELPELLGRGVIVKDPELKIADKSLTKFVVVAFRPEDLKSQEQSEPDSPWNKFKVPFQTILLVVALLLLLTQRELFGLAVQIMGVFVTSVPTLFNFFNLFQKNPVKK